MIFSSNVVQSRLSLSESCEDLLLLCSKSRHSKLILSSHCALFFLSIFAGGPILAQEKPSPDNATIADSDLSTTKQIQQDLIGLGSESYFRREEAFFRLQADPLQTIPLVENELIGNLQSQENSGTQSPEASMRMVHLLSLWASDPDQSPGREAVAALESLSNQSSILTAARARNTLADLTIRQSVLTTERLQQAGAYLGMEAVQIVTAQVPHYLLKIDETFRGNKRQLASMRWLVDVEMARLSGPSIDSEVIQYIAQIPNLKILQLRAIDLTIQDIETISKIQKLDTLEILYSSIDTSFVPMLSELPVSGALRLFGTQLSQSDIDQLTKNLDGIEIVFGRGGFLGIKSASPYSTVVSEVTVGSAAQEAGIKAQDRLTKVQGTNIERFEDLRNELGKYSYGEKILIDLDRPLRSQGPDGQLKFQWLSLQVEVTLGQQP